MSAVASIPDLYSVVSYNTQHLTTAADHWERTADQWENTFRQVHTQAQGLPWEGQAANAAVNRAHGDMLMAVNRADRLRDAAATARNGASQLSDLKKQVVQRIRDAQNDGFDVGDDYSVTDRYQTTDPVQAAQRQATAETYAADLVHRSAALVARDNEVGADIHSQAGDVGVGMFTGGSNGGGRIDGGNYHPGQGRVIAVDNGTDGGAGAVPQPQPPIVKLPPRQTPPTVINMHLGENPQPEPGKHVCPPSEIAKDVTEGVGGPLGVVGSVLGGIAAAPLGPADIAIFGSTGLLGIGATIDGFSDLSNCE